MKSSKSHKKHSIRSRLSMLSKRQLVVLLSSILIGLIVCIYLLNSIYINNSVNNSNNNATTPTPVFTQSPGQTPEPTTDPKAQEYRNIINSLSKENAIFQPKLEPGESSSFYRAYNLGGEEIQIDGKIWRNGKTIRSEFEYDGNVLFDDYSNITFTPEIKDLKRIEMFKDFIWHGGRPLARIKMNNIDNGKYWVFIYVYEETSPTNMDIYLNRKIVASNLSSGEKGSWTKFGPLAVTVTENNIEMVSIGGDVNFSGIELYTLTK